VGSVKRSTTGESNKYTTPWDNCWLYIYCDFFPIRQT